MAGLKKTLGRVEKISNRHLLRTFSLEESQFWLDILLQSQEEQQTRVNFLVFYFI